MTQHDELLARLDSLSSPGWDVPGLAAAAIRELEAKLGAERKARENAEHGQRELCAAIGITTDEWAFSNKRSHDAEQRATAAESRNAAWQIQCDALQYRLAQVFEQTRERCANIRKSIQQTGYGFTGAALSGWNEALLLYEAKILALAPEESERAK